jgi:hypothetical protein
MAVKSKQSTGNAADHHEWPYGKKNYIMFAIAILVIVIGYITLSQGSITWAPILLVIGYCVLIPIALLLRNNDKHAVVSSDNSQSS